MNHLKLFVRDRQKNLKEAVVKVKPKPETNEQAIYNLKEENNLETLNLSRRIKQLENENHRLKCLLEDLANDKLSQAQRIRELNREKSNIENTFVKIVTENQILKEILQKDN